MPWAARRRAALGAAVALFLPLAPGGCGVAYTSASLRESSGPVAVRVVEIAPDTLRRANAAPYTPRPVPAALSERTPAPEPAGLDAAELPPAPPAPPALPALRLPPPAAPEPYRIGVGDVVALTSPRGWEGSASGLAAPGGLRQTFTVQDDGTIAVPGAGRVRIAGQTLARAEEAISAALLAGQVDPALGLEVVGFNARRVAVGGAVRQPTVVPVGLDPPTLDEALAAAGGFEPALSEFAVIRLQRDGTLYQIPLSDYSSRVEARGLVLKDGDSVIVDAGFDLARARARFEDRLRLGEARLRAAAQALAEREAARQAFLARLELDAVPRDHVYLAGELRAPRRVALPFGRRASLAEALFDQGGLSADTGNPAQIYVLRGQGPEARRVTAWHLDARNAAALVLATRFELRPDDVIFVAEQPITRWERVVRQIVPSLITTGVTEASR